MIAAAILAALLAPADSPPVAWAYYCYDSTIAGAHRPTFKIQIEGTRGKGHAWQMIWKDWKTKAEPFAVEVESGSREAEGISWLARDNSRQTGRIEFTGPFTDDLPRMLMIRVGDPETNPGKFDCVPRAMAVSFPPAEQPDF